MATFPILPIHQQTEYSNHHGLLGTHAAGQTTALGNLISPDANGEFVETAVGAPAAAAKNKLAAHKAGIRSDRKLAYVNPTPTMVFEVSATGAALTADLAEPGKRYGLAKDATTTYHTLSLTDTTNAVFELIAHNGSTIAKGAVGDTNARLYAILVAR